MLLLCCSQTVFVCLFVCLFVCFLFSCPSSSSRRRRKERGERPLSGTSRRSRSRSDAPADPSGDSPGACGVRAVTVRIAMARPSCVKCLLPACPPRRVSPLYYVHEPTHYVCMYVCMCVCVCVCVCVYVCVCMCSNGSGKSPLHAVQCQQWCGGWRQRWTRGLAVPPLRSLFTLPHTSTPLQRSALHPGLRCRGRVLRHRRHLRRSGRHRHGHADVHRRCLGTRVQWCQQWRRQRVPSGATARLVARAEQWHWHGGRASAAQVAGASCGRNGSASALFVWRTRIAHHLTCECATYAARCGECPFQPAPATQVWIGLQQPHTNWWCVGRHCTRVGGA